jgi:PEP-CTERM motif
VTRSALPLVALYMALAGQPCRAEMLVGTAQLGLTPAFETNYLFVSFDSSDTPGVSITDVTFNTMAQGITLLDEGFFGRIFINGVGSATFFPALTTPTTSEFGYETTGFGPGASIFDATLELQKDNNGITQSELIGSTVTVDFSDGTSAQTTLTTLVMGPVPGGNNGEYLGVQGIFEVGIPTVAAPEPASLTMMAVGSASLLGFGLRRQRAARNRS